MIGSKLIQSNHNLVNANWCVWYSWVTFQNWGVVTDRGTRLRELEKCHDFGWLCGPTYQSNIHFDKSSNQHEGEKKQS